MRQSNRESKKTLKATENVVASSKVADKNDILSSKNQRNSDNGSIDDKATSQLNNQTLTTASPTNLFEEALQKQTETM